METIRLQLDIDGLAPSAIKVPAGLVQIQVTNGLIVGKAIPIRVFRQNVKLSENKVSKNGTSADSLLRLEPGDYVIEVGGNASGVARSPCLRFPTKSEPRNEIYRLVHVPFRIVVLRPDAAIDQRWNL